MPQEDENLMFITLFSLLSYYQFGNFNSFRNSVEKTLTFHGANFIDEAVSRLSWHILNKFNDLGIIEKTIYKEQQIWELCKNSILSLSANKHLLIGNKLFIDDVTSKLQAEVKSHHVFSTPSKLGVRYHFNVPSVDCLSIELQDAVSQIPDVCHIDAKCIHLLKTLPTLNDYLKYVNRTEPKLLVDKNQNVTVFNFSGRCWDSVDNEIITKQGYYRVNERFGRNSYFIKTDLADFEFNLSDIGYFLACRLLNKPIPIGYQKNDNSIFINGRDFVHLPVLYKRALLINSFSSPVFIGNKIKINNIIPEEFDFLINNFSIFTDNYYV